MNPSEKFLQRLRGIPERIIPISDITADNFEDFLGCVVKYYPRLINLTTSEVFVSAFDAKRKGHPEKAYLIYSNLLSFQAKPNNQKIVKLIEQYPDEGLITADTNGKFDEDLVSRTLFRSLLTGISRNTRIRTEFPNIKTQLFFLNGNQHIQLDEEQQDFVRSVSSGSRISPFTI